MSMTLQVHGSEHVVRIKKLMHSVSQEADLIGE